MTPKENMLRVIRHDNPEWVPNGEEATCTFEPPVIERPYAAGVDPWGVHWSYEEGAEGGTYPTVGRHTIRDLHDWRRQIQVPDLARLDWSEVTARAAKVNREENFVQAFIHMGLFERSYLLLGMEEALVGYVAEPETMYELVGTIADYKIRLAREYYGHIPFDRVLFGDDWGNQNSLFLPPATWRAVIKPHAKRVFDAIHDLGAMVNLHSCGRIEEVFDDIVEIGADMWNPCQPCNDLAGLKKRFGGKITFVGGIDSQFVLAAPDRTPAKVRAEVRRRIDEMAAGGGYVAAPSHGVPYEPEIVNAMNDEIASYGRNFYKDRTGKKQKKGKGQK